MEHEEELNTNKEIQEILSNTNTNTNSNNNNSVNDHSQDKITNTDIKPPLSSSSAKPPILFFINPSSGSREGETILSLAEKIKLNPSLPYHLIHCPNSIDCVIVNLLDKDQMSTAITLLQSLLSPHSTTNEVKILIGGGDGTVLILIEDLHAKEINLSKCIFGHVPLGTGNDLSNALGFGNTVGTEGDERCLYDIIKTYNSAKKCKVDVWNIKLVVENTGKIIEINKEIESIKYDKDKHPLTIFSKTFINYLSLGYDARIGFSFSKQRSTNRLVNKLIYFTTAAKKFCCCSRPYPIKKFISNFQVIDTNKIKLIPKNLSFIKSKTVDINSKSKGIAMQKEKKIDDFDGLITDQDIGEFNTTNHIIFKSEEEKEDDDKDNDNDDINKENGKKKPKRFKQVFIHGDPVTLICQNINFYLGGARDIWKHSGDNMGIKTKNSCDEYRQQLLKMANSEQKFDDKQLEFFTYESEILLGLENLFVGHADKVYHGAGPVKINFVKQLKKGGDPPKVYMNIDGEYLRIDQPKALRIKLNKNLCDGQLNFLQFVNVGNTTPISEENENEFDFF